MPKIMYRPNPVPPPFVPPTPPATNNVVVFSKYPFEVDEVVFMYFKNLELPQVTFCIFEYYSNVYQIWNTAWELEPPLPGESNPYDYIFDVDSSNIGGYRILCYFEDVLIKSIPLTVQTE